MGRVFGTASINGNIWYFDARNRVLKEIRQSDMSLTKIVRLFEGSKNNYRVSCVVNNTVYCAPGQSDSILKYDIEVGKLEELKIDESKNELTFFSTSVLKYNNQLIFIPFLRGTPFIFLDLISGKVTTNYSIVNRIEKELEKELDCLFRYGVLCEEDELLLPSFRTNHVVKLNLSDFSFELIPIGKNGHKVISIVRDNAHAYALVAENPCVYVLDEQKAGVEKEIVLTEDKEVAVLAMVDCGDYLLIPQRNPGKSFIYDKNTDAVVELDLCRGNEFSSETAFTNACPISGDQVALILKDTDDAFGIWDIKRRKIQWHPVKGKTSEKYLNKVYFNENQEYELKGYIDFINVAK